MQLTVEACIDSPPDGELVHRHAFQLEGWVHVEGVVRQRVVTFVDDTPIGSTELWIERDDVARAFGRPQMANCGFTMSCVLPERLRDRPTIHVRVVLFDAEGAAHAVGERWLRLSRYDYRSTGHGTALRDGATSVLRRSDVYGSGPPSPVADPRALNFVQRYLRRGERIVDVGCGIGAYGRMLAPAGYDWTGCEVREDFCRAVHAEGLPAFRVTGNRLPFNDQTFDAALCIEVLEHIDDYAQFVAEIRRVVKRRAVFSVPNFESIPVMSATYAIPWHMLESDHKNFFTRWSLETTLLASFARVEVFEYGPLDGFRAQDGLPVFNHLFAIADVVT